MSSLQADKGKRNYMIFNKPTVKSLWRCLAVNWQCLAVSVWIDASTYAGYYILLQIFG